MTEKLFYLYAKLRICFVPLTLFNWAPSRSACTLRKSVNASWIFWRGVTRRCLHMDVAHSLHGKERVSISVNETIRYDRHFSFFFARLFLGLLFPPLFRSHTLILWQMKGQLRAADDSGEMSPSQAAQHTHLLHMTTDKFTPTHSSKEVPASSCCNILKYMVYISPPPTLL